ncbi:SDR family NAD(P)-dependent oxidoreductase [Adhaeribacter aquaticus]|uniref:SDR family NAD(P)-dependent oxidoreductase n=1 Tax=Adhaeribacter aquaticus TaxID=299567 RepID=UPI0004028A5D|nr:SDR family oxidoreductase [Adhaeribacter aquaticus]
MFDLTGKSAVVTGGASGIGKAISLTFARQGATVHVLDINADNIAQTIAEIKEFGGAAFALPCDVTNQKQVIELYQGIGKIDILVNSAGIPHIGQAHTTTEEDFDRVYQVNVKGVYNSLYAAIPLMQNQGGGVILNVGSVAATVGIPDRFAYTMTKGAVTSMTLSVAKDYLKDNIRCNSIAPGRVHTPFVDGFIAKNYPGREAEMFEKLSKTQPIGRMAKPDEISKLVLYLCSEEASFITGNDYKIDGGFVTLNT